MAHFVSKTPVRVTIDEYPGEYIEIKSKLSLGERNRIYGAMLDANTVDKVMRVNIERYLTLILDLSVVGWHLFARDPETNQVITENEEPVLIPYDHSMIADLDPDDPLVAKTVEEVGRLNPTLTQ